ncbi:MAG: hypothetical protein AMXMBFR37_23030 [Steroidobacteraceae bacterium]
MSEPISAIRVTPCTFAAAVTKLRAARSKVSLLVWGMLTAVPPNVRNQRRAQRVRWIELLGGSDESLLWL